MLRETFTLLAARDFVRGEEQIDRQKMAGACLEVLLRREVNEPNDVKSQAMLISELRHEIVGSASPEAELELDQLVSWLTSPTGPVQEQLDGGKVLCTAPVTRRLPNNGHGEVELRRKARFVTENDDLIEEHFLVPARSRLVSAARRLKASFDLSIERRPALAARYVPQIGQAYEQLQLELPRSR